ncbi:MAG: c-type cytochrome [Legionellaceae bacterium]|nr:c-type cytochrome [Legionellaceae bacterium]
MPVIFIILSFFSHSAWSASHHPQELLNKISGSKTEGQRIVQHYCAMCHAVKPLIPLGAPRIGEASDWKLRLKQGSKRLFKHTDEGLNAMPARGGCFECTDHQLMLAILAMLPEDLILDKMACVFLHNGAE